MSRWCDRNCDRHRDRTADGEALGTLAAAHRDILAPCGRSDSGPLRRHASAPAPFIRQGPQRGRWHGRDLRGQRHGQDLRGRCHGRDLRGRWHGRDRRGQRHGQTHVDSGTSRTDVDGVTGRTDVDGVTGRPTWTDTRTEPATPSQSAPSVVLGRIPHRIRRRASGRAERAAVPRRQRDSTERDRRGAGRPAGAVRAGRPHGRCVRTPHRARAGNRIESPRRRI